jgi:hypothetical protein
MNLKKGTRVVLPMRRGVVEAVGADSFKLRLDDGEDIRIYSNENWLEESMEPSEPKMLREHIERGINRTSSEKGSNTPDFILAEYLVDCLAAFDKAVKQRAEWYGRADHPVEGSHIRAPSDEAVRDLLEKVEEEEKLAATVDTVSDRPRYSTDEEPRVGDKVRHRNGNEQIVKRVTEGGFLGIGFVNMDPAEYELIARGAP